MNPVLEQIKELSPVNRAKLRGANSGYSDGKKQNYTARGLMCLGASCAGDDVSAAYAMAYLKGFQMALDDLRADGVNVQDPRD